MLYFFVARKAEAMLCRDFIDETERKLGTPIGAYSSFAALNETDNTADIFDVKINHSRYSDDALRRKIDDMAAACPALRQFNITRGCLSIDDC